MPGCDPLKFSEIDKVLDTFNGKFKTRNKAMVMFGLGTGLRISEILYPRRWDVVNRDGELCKRIYIRCTKSGEGRAVVFNKLGHLYVKKWLIEQQSMGFHSGNYSVFTNITGKCLSRQYASRLIREACYDAGLEGNYSSHTLRKTYAQYMYEYYEKRRMSGEVGIDPVKMVQIALGQKRYESTMKYLGFLLNKVNEGAESLYDRFF
jgi:site-specific recombinase XerD